jgi:hypothetical protein
MDAIVNFLMLVFFCLSICAAIGAIFSATDSVCTLQVIVEQYAILSYKIK